MEMNSESIGTCEYHDYSICNYHVMQAGMIEGMDTRAGSQVIKAKVPLSEMFGYVTTLRTITSGRATSTMEFSHYAEAPKNTADDVIAKAKGKAEKV